MIYLVPTLVESSATDDARGQRIVQHSRPLSEMMIAGVASITSVVPSSAISAPVQVRLLNYLSIFLNSFHARSRRTDPADLTSSRPTPDDGFLRETSCQDPSASTSPAGSGLTFVRAWRGLPIFAFYTSFSLEQIRWAVTLFGTVGRNAILLVAVALFITGPVLRAGINGVLCASRRYGPSGSDRFRSRRCGGWRRPGSSALPCSSTSRRGTERRSPSRASMISRRGSPSTTRRRADPLLPP